MITVGDALTNTPTLQVDRLTDSIAFPDVLTDTENLDEAYIGLELKDNAYFGNNIEISQWILKQTLKKLDTAVRREGWEMSPLEVSRWPNLFMKNYCSLNDIDT